jgi:hypothetical protein
MTGSRRLFIESAWNGLSGEPFLSTQRPSQPPWERSDVMPVSQK